MACNNPLCRSSRTALRIPTRQPWPHLILALGEDRAPTMAWRDRPTAPRNTADRRLYTLPASETRYTRAGQSGVFEDRGPALEMKRHQRVALTHSKAVDTLRRRERTGGLSALLAMHPFAPLARWDIVDEEPQPSW